MVAPFCGCLLGGWLYDVFIFTGESAVNTPWMGLEQVIRPLLEKWSSSHKNQAEKATSEAHKHA